jgi:UDP-N-acetylmuramate-alanine ligase
MGVGGIGGAFSAGLAGIQKGQEQVTQGAQQVASANTQRPVEPNQDIAQSLMEEKQGQRQVEASAKVVDTANQTIGSLVDISV